MNRTYTATDLLGSWHLDDWRTDFSDGRAPTRPYGERPTGLLVYTADGWMNACLMRRDRSKLSIENTRLAPEGEKALAFDSYFSYAGRYEVKTDRVVHAVSFALNPNFIGSRQVRMIDIEGTRLTLSAAESDHRSGRSRVQKLVWQRQNRSA